MRPGLCFSLGCFLTSHFCSLQVASIFEGEVVNGYPHGRGHTVFRSGITYQGEFANGMMHGKGTLQFKDGSVYEGQLTNNTITGSGRLTWPDKRYFSEPYRSRSSPFICAVSTRGSCTEGFATALVGFILTVIRASG